MKKIYSKPLTVCEELAEKYGILKGDSGEVTPGHSLSKENTLVWEDEEIGDLWGDDESEE